MLSFIRRHLDPAGRLGEILFGLIMALGFTGAVRLGHEQADNRALFTGILGCNLAWALVDGVMYVVTQLFERGREARLARSVRAAPTDEAALALVAAEVDQPLLTLTTAGERRELHRWVLGVLRRRPVEPPRIHLDDLLGGAAVALVILLATFPVVVPYLAMLDPAHAVRVSNLIALAMLFLMGMRWGQLVGVSPFRTGASLASIGIALVLITIALGG